MKQVCVIGDYVYIQTEKDRRYVRWSKWLVKKMFFALLEYKLEEIEIAFESKTSVNFLLAGYPFLFVLEFTEHGTFMHGAVISHHDELFEYAYDIHHAIPDSIFRKITSDLVCMSKDRLRTIAAYSNYQERSEYYTSKHEWTRDKTKVKRFKFKFPKSKKLKWKIWQKT